MIDLLVVEPSVSVRKTLERLLELAGYTMRGVTRATDALGQVDRQRPDLVLSEVALPDGGGLELCQQFRLIGLPVLLMSPHANDQLRRESLGAGALELLSKPLSEQHLLGRLAHHLKLPTPALGVAQPPTTLLSGLMTRPGVLGAAHLRGGVLIEATGRAIPPALYQAFLARPERAHQQPTDMPGPVVKLEGAPQPCPAASPAVGRTGTVQEDTLQVAQLEYPGHCLLLFQLPGQDALVCLIQNSSYATLIKYYLRSSPYIRL